MCLAFTGRIGSKALYERHHRKNEVLASAPVGWVFGTHVIPFASSSAATSAGVAFPVATSSSVLNSSTANRLPASWQTSFVKQAASPGIVATILASLKTLRSLA
jgi:hypothetical protein